MTTPTPVSVSAATPADPDAYLMPPGYIATLVDGRIVAIPVADTTAVPAPDPTSAGPVVEAPASTDAGLSLATRQCLLYGALITVAAGGAFWMVAAGLAEMAPAMDGIVHVLKWLAVFVALLVGAVVAAKVRTRKGEGTTTLSLFHSTSTTTKHTSIGKQIAKGRSTFTNNL